MSSLRRGVDIVISGFYYILLVKSKTDDNEGNDSMNRFKQHLSVIISILFLGFGVISCSDSTTEPGSGDTLPQADVPNLMTYLPDNADQTVQSMITLAQSQIALGQTLMDSVGNRLGDGGQETVTQGQVEITFTAEEETREGIDGVLRTVTFDGAAQVGDTTLTFTNEQIFTSWISNDGDFGEYMFDFSAYTNVADPAMGSDDASSTYNVEWSITENGVLNYMSNLTSSTGETTSYDLVINADGSGAFSQDGSILYEWNADGELINQ